ncbi:DEAD/DEAH box helicase [Sporosarcina sp. G11-34]|uniref:DEAD/DEAH box helicase n=1 Tax=Sporosarcina sp. G11-34 TaxID=2849605 RepID=UPI0022A99B45|nr:DEAD/DEAH box helicase family protein [Sporosarcina sp. G11-34]MCZ2257269.1 DEAD/DEAH box helicase family protein [Sporosarcina sp. G11-34]
MTNTGDPAVRDFLTGRIWLREHTPFPAELIDSQIDQGTISILPGIKSTPSFLHQSKHFCNRCENTTQTRFTTFTCAKCEGDCTYCRHCLKMGRVSSCTDLIIWTGQPSIYPVTHSIAWAGILTPRQQKASNELGESTTLQRPHLIHAVCGAGKTEILFEPIHKQLQAGKRVCIAAPRVDVILELEPRFRAAFPTTTIEALYGGAKPSHASAQLILATTHQLYRFRKAFDVIFVDEADAFPYTADETLRRAVKKAAKPQAPIHSVTATPSKKLIATMKQTGAISTINRRYHGHALPVPRYETLWNYTRHIKRGRLPVKLRKWTEQRLERKEPFLIFFHNILLMEEAEPLIQKLDGRINAVHAAHPDRKVFVQALRDEKIPGLLTTTILERGITIPNVQVAVIGSEQQTFTSAALVQIGGRVGRSSEHPTGDFVLFHHGISHAMDDANREIIRLNKGGAPI